MSIENLWASYYVRSSLPAWVSYARQWIISYNSISDFFGFTSDWFSIKVQWPLNWAYSTYQLSWNLICCLLCSKCVIWRIYLINLFMICFNWRQFQHVRKRLDDFLVLNCSRMTSWNHSYNTSLSHQPDHCDPDISYSLDTGETD